MTLSEDDERTEHEALKYARANKKDIAERLTDPTIFVPEDEPVSVFMAGSPGAGKTEASIELLEAVDNSPTIRIDPDDLRDEFNEYNGHNAWLFQKAVSVLVEKIHDKALQQKQSFLLDGTLSHYEKALQNIKRSLKKKRFVQILYVYQEPVLAWRFVQAREKIEGRRIMKEDFIEQYFAAREVVNRLKREFGGKIQVDLLLKNIDNSHRMYKANIDQIDHHIKEKYSRADVEELLRDE